MSRAQAISFLRSEVEEQPCDVHGLSPEGRDVLIISTLDVDGTVIALSRYGDMQWRLVSKTTNKTISDQTLDFSTVPEAIRASMKAILYRYIRRGRAGGKRPGTASVINLLCNARPFLQHLARLNITRIADVTPMVCAVYVDACKKHRLAARTGKMGKPLARTTLQHRLLAVESIFELSQHTEDKMPAHPWPETSANHIAGKGGRDLAGSAGKTPLIPDEVFTALFQKAWELVERGDELLGIREGLETFKSPVPGLSKQAILTSQRHYLQRQGWSGGIHALNETLLDLRTACYIVVASVSGCRNHELALIQSEAWYSTGGTTAEDEREVYWWMRSQSIKTDEGHTEWMIPEAAVAALRIMDRWAKPWQGIIEAEITQLRETNPLAPEIAEAQRHLRVVFLGKKGNKIRTLANQHWNVTLKAFAQKCGLTWDLTSHQFRRTFANYAARSQFGDLRYLREHFKHWSLDMTLGYALNESQEMALYIEIQDELDEIKAGLVDSWLRPGEPLAGGYGTNLVDWRGSEAVTIFKNHKHMVRSLADSTSIRSNGHAWCTADDNMCVGNDIEHTRCSDCNNAVIGLHHARLYRGLYDHLKEVLVCNDIGEGGLNLVRRDLERCRSILTSLGQDPQECAA